MRLLILFCLLLAAVFAAESIPYYKHIDFAHKFMKKHKRFAKRQYRLLAKQAKKQGKKFDKKVIAYELHKGLEQIRQIQKLDVALQPLAWAQKPELMHLKNDLKSMEKIMKLHTRSLRRKAIRKNKRVAVRIAALALVSPFDKNSPFNADNINEKKPNTKIETKTQKHHHPHRNFTQEDGSLRLMFSTVIPPGKNLPDTRRLSFTDRKGRKCRCLC